MTTQIDETAVEADFTRRLAAALGDAPDRDALLAELHDHFTLRTLLRGVDSERWSRGRQDVDLPPGDALRLLVRTHYPALQRFVDQQ